MMPKWSYGFWQSRQRYTNQKELLDVIAEYRKRKIPLDNIVLDWSYWPENAWGSHDFDPVHFPDPDGMVASGARRIAARAGSPNTLDVLEAMTRAIRRDFRYGARHELTAHDDRGERGIYFIFISARAYDTIEFLQQEGKITADVSGVLTWR